MLRAISLTEAVGVRRMFSIYDEALNVSKEILNFNYGRFWDVLSKLGAHSTCFFLNESAVFRRKKKEI